MFNLTSLAGLLKRKKTKTKVPSPLSISPFLWGGGQFPSLEVDKMLLGTEAEPYSSS